MNLKKTLLIVTVLLIIGMWMGINFAKGKSLFSNPFAEQDIRDKATGTAKELLNDARSVVKKSLDKAKPN